MSDDTKSRPGHDVRHPATRAFVATLPVLFGYVPLGAAFGFLIVQAGCPPVAAVVMSLTVYAGAAQYLAIGLLTDGVSVFQIAVAVFLLNTRHVFYGLSFLDRYASSPWKAYLWAALTDETYAILSAENQEDDDESFCVLVSMFNHSYWVLGTLVGAAFGIGTEFPAIGLDFALTCLFVVLVTERARDSQRYWPFVVGLLSAWLAIVVAPGEMLLVASGLSAMTAVLIPAEASEVAP